MNTHGRSTKVAAIVVGIVAIVGCSSGTSTATSTTTTVGAPSRLRRPVERDKGEASSPQRSDHYLRESSARFQVGLLA